MGRKFSEYIIFAAMLILISGCRLNYKEADITDTFSDSVPNSILTSFSQTVVENKATAYTVEADRAELYDKTPATYFENISFKEFDSEGNVGTEGAARKATYYSNNDNIIFDGDMIINSMEQDFIVRSNYMEWDNKNRILKSRDDTPVTIEQGEGTYISGRGFISDAASKTFTFLEKAEGRFFKEEEENDEENN